VEWNRSLPDAQLQAQRTGRPLLVLFDEVPGCRTCVHYGQAVLTHPLLVEAAETAFVPVAIYNNRPGADRAALERFGEPSWNNPVVRIVDADLQPLARRLAGDYRIEALARTMTGALARAGRPVPVYLRALHGADRPARAVFAMHCFWTGEACIGPIEGIQSTRTGFLAGREVVEVSFDPDTVSRSQLYAEIAARGCADTVLVHDAADAESARAHFRRVVTTTDRVRGSPKDDRYALRRSLARHLPLAPRQATLANARVAAGRSFEDLLSPRQRELWRAIQAHPQAAWPDASRTEDLTLTFEQAERTLARLDG
jgi:hypothetical protein